MSSIRAVLGSLLNDDKAVKNLFDHVRNTTLCAGFLIAGLWSFRAGLTDPYIDTMLKALSIPVVLSSIFLFAVNIFDGSRRIDGWSGISASSRAGIKLVYAISYFSGAVLFFIHAFAKKSP
jgi:hypothetical protein